MSKRKLIVIGLLSTLFFLTSCQQGSLDEASFEKGSGNLEATVGQLSDMEKKDFFPQYHLFHELINVVELTDYNMPTGKWFIYDDEGEFTSDLPFGQMAAASNYEIKFYLRDRETLDLNRNITIQLTKRTNSGEELQVLNETIFVNKIRSGQPIYENNLPYDVDVAYFLSVEILDEENNVEDTVLSLIYVPKLEINAQLSIEKDVYKSGDEMKISLTNFGPTHLFADEYFTIEKLVNDDWRIVPLNSVFRDIGILISVGNTYDQMVTYEEELTAGQYRIVKKIHAENLPLEEKLAVEFTIE